eukprot:TRINITY_DN3340_c0_g2_i1.p1 TRINITY_DN3340_c0_g2~~TRINITY_DN3340_c0_g2_i1.p1  ORF type:complete len:350 (-),score=55.47 TRINITY_DN3340_c0_g2_i1:167-1216(-)
MEGRSLKTKQVILAAYAKEGPVTEQHLKLVEGELDTSSVVANADKNVVAVKNLWISVDPYLRLCIKERENVFGHPYLLNQPLHTLCVSKVIASANPEFKVGDTVFGHSDVAEYAVIPAAQLHKIEADDVVSLPELVYLLGPAGFSAWIGFVLIAEPKAGEQVFVSAAAGAVGLVVGQLAKIKGCRVVGSAGSDEKVKLLKEEFGFDDAFNYKSETDWDAVLSRYFPKGIDIYFENVGGRMLEAVLNNVNTNARIPVCGTISQYNEDWKECYGVRNLSNLLLKAVKMQGFHCGSYLSPNNLSTFKEEMIGYIKQGKLKLRLNVQSGVESFLDAFNNMFRGGSIGKTIIQV